MNEQSMDILERIRASYYQLTAAERKVADYVLTQHSQVQFMSITQLADECGTAETTVTRFCRSLKLKGFNAFKIELARHSVLGASSHREPVSTDTLAGRVQESGRLAIDAVHQTTELMDLNQIGRAVELIEQAPTVLCLGSGGSMIMACECAHLFSTMTGKFTTISDADLCRCHHGSQGCDHPVFLFRRHHRRDTDIGVGPSAGHPDDPRDPVPEVPGGEAVECGSALRLKRKSLPIRLRAGEGGPAGRGGRGVSGILPSQPGKL